MRGTKQAGPILRLGLLLCLCLLGTIEASPTAPVEEAPAPEHVAPPTVAPAPTIAPSAPYVPVYQPPPHTEAPGSPSMCVPCLPGNFSGT